MLRASWDLHIKHLIDFVVAFILLVILSPLMLVVALAVKISSYGPVLFRQDRVGKNGQMFTIYKFRTMTVDVVAKQGRFDAGDSSRVTKIGSILRGTKIDELPQLYNVVCGDMSLVGPRPEVKKWVDIFADRWDYVLSVRPGITDPASVMFRDEEKLLARAADPIKYYREEILPIKLTMYEEYVAQRSVMSDIFILLRTFQSLFRKKANS